MNEEEVKTFAHEAVEFLPDNTNRFEIKSDGETVLAYKDEDGELSKITTKIDITKR